MAFLGGLALNNRRDLDPSLLGIHRSWEFLHAFLHLLLLILGPRVHRSMRHFFFLGEVLLNFQDRLFFYNILSFLFLFFGCSSSLNVSCLLLCDLLGLLNDLLLILALDKVGNDFPSLDCAWWEFGNTLGEQGNFFRSPFFDCFLELGKSVLLISLGAILLIDSLSLVGLRLNDVKELGNILRD